MNTESKPETLGLQIAGFTLGLLSMLICLLPGLVIVTASLGGVFSGIGMQKRSLKGLAIAGLVLSIVAAVINALIYQQFFFQ